MAGEFKYTALDTTATKTADARYAEAFCEGRVSWVAGVATNPYPSGSPNNIAWQAGYDTTSPQGLIDNCALAIPILTPSLTGLTSAAAQTAILNANLTVGKITGTTGVVNAQNPAVSAKAQPKDVVTFTIA
jgi:hypothetical protein